MAATSDVAQLILAYRYWIIFPLACLEGPLVAFAVGSFAARGLFEVYAAFGVLMLGDLLPDLSYFLIGRRAARSRRLARWVERHDRVGRSARAVSRLWRRHGLRTMLISKLSYGLSTPLLMSAGSSGLPIRRLAAYAIPVTVLQYGVLFTLGYYLGAYFRNVASIWRYVGIVAAGVLLVFVARLLIGSWLGRSLGSESDRED